MVKLIIDRKPVSVPEGTTILEAARSVNIEIPTLCYLKGINEIAACRLCMVEIEGYPRLVPSCDNVVAEGMVVHTNSPRAREARRVNMRLLLSQHDTHCTKCTRSGNCKLQKLTNDYNLLGDHYIKDLKTTEDDFSNPVVRIENRCVRCMRCVQVCDKIQSMNIWDLMGTGSRTTIGVGKTRRLGDSDCTFCGQCIIHCPVGALQERDDTGRVFDALPNMTDACGDPDVDVVLTTREMVRMFRGEQIVPATLEETPFDSPLGTGTGAAVVFGSTGGVMDAALRTAYRMVTGSNPDPDAFHAIRGMDGWKEAVFEIPGAGAVRIAVVSGLGNTRKLMRALEQGDVSYDFVEVMACPGGCAGGGGQPIHDGVEMAESRGSVLWALDRAEPVRFSHENPDVMALYRDFLGAPMSAKSHHLLHTDHHAWKMPSGN